MERPQDIRANEKGREEQMSLYDFIMSQGFSKEDWAELGKGNITDKDIIEAMLAEGYEGISE